MGNTTERVLIHFVLFLFLYKGGKSMKVNGTTIPLDKSQSLLDFLETQKFNINTIAVERNGEIIPRAEYKNVMLKDEDTLEIVRFVGGG